MIIFMCLALPPVFFMFVREKILGRKMECAFYGKAADFIKEYLLSALFLNFTAITVTCHVFKHRGELYGAFNNTNFTFHYLSLTLALALGLPLIEYVMRFHLHTERFEFSLPAIKFNKNALLYIYAFVLFALNFIRIFDNAFWGDEGFSIRLAKMSLGGMIEATAKDVHPPLYYMLLQLLYKIFGNEGFAYHLSSIIPYAAILIVACIFVKSRFGYIAAAVLVTLASLTKCAVQYNVEVRMYVMASLFVLLAFLAFYEILKQNNFKSYLVFVIASLGAGFTHYYALISVAMLYLVLLAVAYYKREYLKNTVIAYAATTAVYLPWLLILVKAFERTANNWWLKHIPSIKDCIKFLFDDKWVCIVFALVILLFSLYQLKIFSITENKNAKFLECFDFHISYPKKLLLTDELIWIYAGLFSIFGTIAVGLALSHLIRPFFVLRYLFPTAAMAYLIMGYCVSRLKYHRLWGVLLLIALLCSNLPVYLNTYKSQSALNKSTAVFMNKVQPTKEAIIYTDNSHMCWTLLEYYYPENKRGLKNDVMQTLDAAQEETWLFWSKELDEKTLKAVKGKGYSYEKIHTGRFANGVNYHVYKLRKEVGKK